MNQAKRIVQIVPSLPPATCGVGDYAVLLAGEWSARDGVETDFLVANRSFPESGSTGSLVLRSHSALELSAAIEESASPGDPVLLHYVGYGYQKRGVPFWLLRGIESWLKKDSKRRLGIFFHELYASGHSWTSAFWVSPLQRWVCTRLANCASHCFTNRTVSAQWLSAKNNRSASSIPVLPVFSNLGEPAVVDALESRKPQVAVYGDVSRSIRNRDFAIKCLREVCLRLGLERVVAFGKSAGAWADLGFPTEHRGVLTQNDASRLLMESRAAYLDYFDGYLGKSGIFAAYCAHGLLPILLWPNSSEQDGLFNKTHYIAASDPPPGLEYPDQQAIADSARQWYIGHSRAKVASAIAERLFPGTP